MKVKEIMSQPVITVTADTTLEAVAGVMLRHNIGCVPVMDDDAKLVGIITHSDFIAKKKGIPFSRVRLPMLLGYGLREGTETIYDAAKSLTAGEIMTPNPVVLTEDDLVKTFLEKMLNDRVTHVPIVRGDSVIGVVARHDLLKMIAD
ncbi:MAG: CBS domain-containing protein [Pyrinomonadaceae bacterium]